MSWISGEATASTYIRGRLVVEESRSGTTSTITAILQVRRTNSYGGQTYQYGNGCKYTINIDGTGYDINQTAASHVVIPAYNNNWIEVGRATKAISHTAAKTITCSWSSTNMGSYLSCSGSVSCGLAAFITEIGASLSNVVSRSNDVHATIKWTDQSGAQVYIACEEIDDSGNYKSLIHQWTNQSGKSGTTYSLTAAERLKYDGLNRNRIRWTLKTVINGTETYFNVHDYDYNRASTPSVITYPNNTPDFNVGDSIYIHCNRQRSNMTHSIVVTIGNFSKTVSSNATDNAQWVTANDKSSIYNQNTTGTSKSGTVTLNTYISGTLIGTKTCAINAKFKTSEMTPAFSNFTYNDSNSVTTAITGNDQYLIQGKSTLNATISTANKMAPKYSATGSTYYFSFGSTTVSKAFSSSAAVSASLGTPASSGSQRLTVKALDSRGLSTSVYKDIPVVAYAAPVPKVTITRLNDFENQTTIKLSATYSPIYVANVEKNAISAVQYRYKKVNTSTWGSWQNLSYTASDGTITVPNLVLNLDNEYAWDFEFRVTDKLETKTVSGSIQVGIPIVHFGSNGTIGVNCMPSGSTKGIYVNAGDHIFQQIYPVNAIFESTSSTNPSTYFGGTWSQLGTRTVRSSTVYTFKRTA